jgi:hypothetical protein
VRRGPLFFKPLADERNAGHVVVFPGAESANFVPRMRGIITP